MLRQYKKMESEIEKTQTAEMREMQLYEERMSEFSTSDLSNPEIKARWK